MAPLKPGANFSYDPINDTYHCNVCGIWLANSDTLIVHNQENHSTGIQAAVTQYMDEQAEGKAWGKAILEHCNECLKDLGKHILDANTAMADTKNTHWLMHPDWFREMRTWCEDANTGASPWAGMPDQEATVYGYPVRLDKKADLPILVYNSSNTTQGLSSLQQSALQNGWMTNSEAWAQMFPEAKPRPIGEAGIPGQSFSQVIYDEIASSWQKPVENPYTIKPKPIWTWDGKPITGFQGWSGVV